MPKRKSKIDVDFMLFECEMHRLLDLLGAPKGRYVAKRLSEYLTEIGIDPSWDAEIKRELARVPEKAACENCGAIHRKGTMCANCYGKEKA